MSDKIIEFKDVSFQYETQSEPTLKNINLTIYEGEKILVCGPSGSGKSTFAQCINGLIPNKYEGELTGTVTIHHQNLADSNLFDLSFETSTVLQDTDSQFIGLTVAEDIAFALENDCVTQKDMKKIVKQWAEVVDVDRQLSHKPQELSGGQKQRVSMAGVMINEAPILLFDEPLANLDPAASQSAIDLIDQIHQDEKNTIIIVEHRLEEVLTKPVDRIILFQDGEIIADQKPSQLLASSILQDNGIREPLYITALKNVGIDINQVNFPDQLSKLALSSKDQEKIVSLHNNNDVVNSSILAKKLLEIRNLSYQYGKNGTQALKNVSTVINEGELLAIVGKNGAGKSTLFKSLCGFIKPEGDLLWKNESMNDFSIKERADKIGYVMQNPNQMISKTKIFDEVALGLRLRNVDEAIIKKRVEEVLKICGLYPFRNWPIAALSFGQKKRVTIASILVLEPELLILDEPTAGQDYTHYTEMMSFIMKLKKLGKTIIMITHDMHLMLEYADRVLVFADGELLADTQPTKLLSNQELVQKASLKETSLFHLAKKVGIDPPSSLVESFICIEKERRGDEK